MKIESPRGRTVTAALCGSWLCRFKLLLMSLSPASPADSWSTTPPSSPPQDYYASTASAVVGAGSPLQRLDSVQIDPLPRVYSFEALTSRSL